LEQSLPFLGGSGPGGGPYYYVWVQSFLCYALVYGLSVNQALDAASYDVWNTNFASSCLRTGFTAYWDGMGIPSYLSKLAVYGNGDLHLKNYEPHTVGTPVVSGPTSGAVGASVTLSVCSVDSSSSHSVKYFIEWADGTTHLTGYYPSGTSVPVSHTWSANGVYGVKVHAICNDGNRSSWSARYDVAIGANPVLTINAFDIFYGYEYYMPVYVDGQLLSSYTPVSCPVSAGWHTVNIMDQYYTYLVFAEFSDGYNNGDGRPIYSNTMLTAYYRSP